MSAKVKMVKLSSGYLMPMVGIGTWKSKPGEVEQAVRVAIDTGYRHIDCAPIYENEAEVGSAIKERLDSGAVKREDLFIVSKLWNTRHSANDVRPSCLESLKSLGLDYLDLYLIHWPTAWKAGKEFFPTDDKGNTVFANTSNIETWKAMEELVKDGLVKSIGVSNFNSQQIQEVLDNCSIKPVTNQVEIHPYLSQEKLCTFCEERGIVMTAYSPFASPDRPYAPANETLLLDDPTLKTVADQIGKTPAQVVLRWLIQRNIVVIPKSVTPMRIQANFQVNDFELSSEQMSVISSLNRDERRAYPKTEKGEYFNWHSPNFPFNIEF